MKKSLRSRVGYGLRIKKRLGELEIKQKKKQICPFCKREGVKRQAKGIWYCKKCGKKFSSGAYYIE